MDFLALFQGFTVLSVILFLAGIALLVLEMLQPGFGVFGILGLCCLIADIILSARSFTEGLILTGIVFLVLLILLLIFLRLASKGKVPRRLVLKDSTDRQSGFSSSSDLAGLVGKTGRASTTLRPAGCAVIDGEKYDVVSQGDYIEPDTEIVVVEVEGSRIVVGALSQKQTYVHR